MLIFYGYWWRSRRSLAASALIHLTVIFKVDFYLKAKRKITCYKYRIKNLNKKYELNEIVSGDSIFCATGITSGDLVDGIKIENDEFISETLITHKSSGLRKKLRLNKKFNDICFRS